MSRFLVLTEIFEDTNLKRYSRPPTADESYSAFSTGSHFNLRRVVINAQHISAMREDIILKEKLTTENKWPGDLDSRQGFTKIQLNCGAGRGSSSTLSVVGDLSLVTKKVLENNSE